MMDDIRERFDSISTDDVAVKRLEMLHIFELILEKHLDEEFDQPSEALKDLKNTDGYMYKLSQDFLLSSSTMEKENKLEKIIAHINRLN